jgi:catechol 2,3-dioxygenase-like lactoylglutathione lyase family enzyme
MITGVQDVYYNVADMERAVRFYADVLGMQKVFGDAWWTRMQCGSLGVGLHKSDGAVPAIAHDAHGAHVGATLTLKSDAFEADCARLEAAGVQFLSKTNDPWGKVGVFKDLDGNILKLMQPSY